MEVGEREYAPLPDTRDHVLVGPGVLHLTRYPDGKIGGHVVKGKTVPTTRALKADYKRKGWPI